GGEHRVSPYPRRIARTGSIGLRGTSRLMKQKKLSRRSQRTKTEERLNSLPSPRSRGIAIRFRHSHVNLDGSRALMLLYVTRAAFGQRSERHCSCPRP